MATLNHKGIFTFPISSRFRRGGKKESHLEHCQTLWGEKQEAWWQKMGEKTKPQWQRETQQCLAGLLKITNTENQKETLQDSQHKCFPDFNILGFGPLI